MIPDDAVYRVIDQREYRNWKLLQVSVARPSSFGAALRLAWGIDVFFGWFPLLKALLVADVLIAWWLGG